MLTYMLTLLTLLTSLTLHTYSAVLLQIAALEKRETSIRDSEIRDSEIRDSESAIGDGRLAFGIRRSSLGIRH